MPGNAGNELRESRTVKCPKLRRVLKVPIDFADTLRAGEARTECLVWSHDLDPFFYLTNAMHLRCWLSVTSESIKARNLDPFMSRNRKTGSY